MKKRCHWVPAGNELYEQYHDLEWGVPCHDDRKHFEFLILEGAQAGLSWLTILKKREGYRKAFANFDPIKVAQFDEQTYNELLLFDGIVKNRLKIRAAINNAKLFLEIQKQFGSFDAYIWGFVQNKTIQHRAKIFQAESKESIALSKDLVKRGFKFVGPKVMYSHMQALGLINDHESDCFCSK